MAWVTWRQHRLQALVAGGFVTLAAIAAAVSAVPILHAYHRAALAACAPPSTRSGCDLIVRHFQDEFAGGTEVRWLILLPALAGVFVGAPLIARELEQGTYRFVWTQAVTRRRWLLSKTLLLAVGTAAAAAVLAAAVTWWRQPFDTFAGRMTPSTFDVEGTVVPAYAVFALALGIFAGALLRRTVPAMSLALGGFFAVRLLVSRFARPHYLAPLHQTTAGIDPSVRARDWVLDNSFVDAVGHRIAARREDLAILHAQHAGVDPNAYLLSLGWKRVVTYQPAGRFWDFQAIETAIFLALAAALVLAAVALVRRRPA
jgi:ABC-2 family transporter protein